MCLLGKNVYLKKMTLEDTERIISWRNSKSVKKHFIYRESFTKEGHENWYHTMVESGKAVQFVIYLADGDKPVGSVYLRDIDRQNQKAEFGIFIEEGIQGKGVGTEAASLIVKHGFEELGLNKIVLRVLAENERARKSYRKVGFVEEGYFKEDSFVEGKFVDIVMMAIFAKDRVC